MIAKWSDVFSLERNQLGKPLPAWDMHVQSYCYKHHLAVLAPLVLDYLCTR